MNKSHNTIVYLDETEIHETMRTTFQRMNVEYIAVTDDASLFKALDLFMIDIVVLAVELKTKPEFIDFEYGPKIQKLLYERGYQQPIIFTTTSTFPEPAWIADQNSRVKIVITPKPGFPTLTSAVKKMLSDNSQEIAEEEPEYIDEIYLNNQTNLFLASSDKYLLRFLMETFLERKYHITIFQKPDELKHSLLNFSGKCGIALIDMTMDNLQPYSLIEEVKENNPLIHFLPLGYELSEKMRSTLDRIGLKADSEFKKPFNLRTLVLHIRNIAFRQKALGWD